MLRPSGETAWTACTGSATPTTRIRRAFSNARDGLRASRGRFGGVAFAEGQVQPYPNTSGPIEIHVPLRARRTLNGASARRPKCRAQGSGAPPCSRSAARDHVQVVVEVGVAVAPTLLVADAGLFGRR